MKVTPTLLIATAATAWPLDLHNVVKSNTQIKRLERTSVLDDEILNMRLYSQYAAASYCNSGRERKSTIKCAMNTCTDVTEHNATIFRTMKEEGETAGFHGIDPDTQGFVAYDPIVHAVVVSFRGSATLMNWYHNFQIRSDYCYKYMGYKFNAAIMETGKKVYDDCGVHRGFASSWRSVRDATLMGIKGALSHFGDVTTAAMIDINDFVSVGADGEIIEYIDADANAWSSEPEKVSEAINSNTETPLKIILTGHSLGGAVATIAAAELRSFGVSCDLFTYGSPRVGNEAFATFLTNQQPHGSNGINNYRVTYMYDAVPQVPAAKDWIVKYRHTSPEFWFHGNSEIYNSSDVEVCHGYKNLTCNSGRTHWMDITSNIREHNQYFMGKINECDA